LIFGVVLWPVYEMIRTSMLDISSSGKERGFVGLDNYVELLENPNLMGAVSRTVVWMLIVVFFTIVISLGLAQLLNANFPGKRYVRWIIIVPWASSVIMTATSFRWMLDGYYGLLNRVLLDRSRHHHRSSGCPWKSRHIFPLVDRGCDLRIAPIHNLRAARWSANNSKRAL